MSRPQPLTIPTSYSFRIIKLKVKFVTTCVAIIIFFADNSVLLCHKLRERRVKWFGWTPFQSRISSTASCLMLNLIAFIPSINVTEHKPA